MKAKELIEILKEHPDFEVRFTVWDRDDDGMDPPFLRRFSIDGLCEVGHSDRIILLEGDDL